MPFSLRSILQARTITKSQASARRRKAARGEAPSLRSDDSNLSSEQDFVLSFRQTHMQEPLITFVRDNFVERANPYLEREKVLTSHLTGAYLKKSEASYENIKAFLANTQAEAEELRTVIAQLRTYTLQVEAKLQDRSQQLKDSQHSEASLRSQLRLVFSQSAKFEQILPGF